MYLKGRNKMSEEKPYVIRFSIVTTEAKSGECLEKLIEILKEYSISDEEPIILTPREYNMYQISDDNPIIEDTLIQ